MPVLADTTPAWPSTDPGREAPGGTRVSTARALCAALRDTAGGIGPGGGGLAMPLAVLWSRTHKFDAADARWPDRDRFVLSSAAATPLLYALLHLTGHPGMEQATLDHCGEMDAVATLAAEYGRHPAIEASAAPGGQAVAMAVGMALAERVMAGRFGKSLVDHRVWAVADAAELAAGVTQEAAALAGQLKLDRLVLLVDATAPDADDARARFASAGWAVKQVAAADPEAIEAALSFAVRSRKPTLLWCVPGDPEGAASRTTTNALAAWRRVGARGAAARRAWLKRLTRHPQRPEFERVLAGRLPDGWHDALTAWKHRVRATCPVATADHCGQIIDRVAACVPELVCGQVDRLLPGGGGDILPGQYSGRYVAFSNRPHGMAACANGMALHGGTLPMTASASVDAVEQLPALRLAATLRRRLVHLVFDPGLGGLGRAWQASELLGWLRCITHLHVFRPACAIETAECMELAIGRTDGPSLLMVSRTPTPALRSDTVENRCARGGYVLAQADGPRRATLIASGPGLIVALRARDRLGIEGIAAAVVSLPCWALFAAQDDSYRRAVLGDAPRFAVEGAGRSGWDRWLGEGGKFLGLDSDDAGPADGVRQRHGLTPDLIAQSVSRHLGLTAARPEPPGRAAPASSGDELH